MTVISTGISEGLLDSRQWSFRCGELDQPWKWPRLVEIISFYDRGTISNNVQTKLSRELNAFSLRGLQNVLLDLEGS